MKKSAFFSLAIMMALPVLALAGQAQPQSPPAKQQPAAQAHVEAFGQVEAAVAVLIPTEGNQTGGTVYFKEMGDHVHILGFIHGLQPNGEHGFHVHEWGDISAPDGESAGEHYNPEGHPHALPQKQTRHAGDLGNVKADASGNARIELTVRNLTLAGLKNPIVGRALVIHAKPDTGAQPSGGSGPRLAQGVIGIADVEQVETAARSRPRR